MKNIQISFLVCSLLFLGNTTLLAQKLFIAADDVKMRSCDGLDCGMITLLERGTECTFLEQGKLETIDGYGTYSWWLVKCGGQKGYVFSGLLDVAIGRTENEKPVYRTGYVRDNVNVRVCPNTQKCPIYTQLLKGTYVEIQYKCKEQQDVGEYGVNHWYYIKSSKAEGYVFGGLLFFEPNSLVIDSVEVNVHSEPNEMSPVVRKVRQGDRFTIFRQGGTSELVRPYGRNYWYQIKGSNEIIGWVYGVFTSKKNVSVDCQCVDYLKKTLSIKGPTKNAFEWDEVLQGAIPVLINQQEKYLNYQEIKEIDKVKKGDIAMFDKEHPEVNRSYGHVGFVDAIKKSSGDVLLVIEGANHKLPMKVFYDKRQCNNVSKKTYKYLQKLVRFFRK